MNEEVLHCLQNTWVGNFTQTVVDIWQDHLMWELLIAGREKEKTRSMIRAVTDDVVYPERHPTQPKTAYNESEGPERTVHDALQPTFLATIIIWICLSQVQSDLP